MSWLSRLTSGLSKTSAGLTDGIAAIFTKRRIDAAMLEELEELLIRADVGVSVATDVVGEFGRARFDKEIAPEEVRRELANLLAQRVEAVAQPFTLKAGHRPMVVLVVGVNGNGKTTTIGKLAHWLRAQGHSVMLAAADTFRAAAVEQLQVWGQRTHAPVITGAPNADPASVAFRALEEARAQAADVLLIDTAGRLHNKANLMDELAKIVKVIKKIDDTAPHAVLQVLDGTTGQNALQQVAAFKELVDVSGLIVTKLDGTARAGIIVALAEQFSLPIHAIGVGENIDDLQPFSAQQFANSLLGVEA